MRSPPKVNVMPQGDREARVGRRIQRQRPVRLGGIDALGALPVEGGGGELPWLHRGVEPLDGADQPLHVDAEAIGEAIDAVRLDL